MGGVARFFAGLGIGLAGLFAISLLAALVAYDAAKPYIEREYPTELYERDDDCRRVPCFSTMAEDSFRVEEGMREVSFVVYAVLEAATGPADVTIVDPSGDVRYHRLFTPEPGAPRADVATQDSATWSGEPGEWTLTRSYVGTVGFLSYDAWGIGLPPGTLG